MCGLDRRFVGVVLHVTSRSHVAAMIEEVNAVEGHSYC